MIVCSFDNINTDDYPGLLSDMKTLATALLLLALFGCTKHYASDEFDVSAIEAEASEILSSNNVIPIDLPPTIAKLNPKNVYINDDGLFIQLNGFFVSESGMFIPRKGVVVEENNNGEPQFTRLHGNVYSYVIKG